MAYQARNFEPLLGVEGFSAKLLKDHFKLYNGYVAATNKLLESLDRLSPEDGSAGPQRDELRHRFGWEFNGMRLHELYFENMAPKGGGREALGKDSLAGVFMRKVQTDFGGLDRWESDFREVGGMRGIGWAILYFDPKAGRLFNVWINEHDGGHPATASPILVMDVFEHAYVPDYGLDRKAYIQAFLKIADWKQALRRYQRAAGVEIRHAAAV